ncbi:MAG TPA: methyltransferase [Casimicrobiaceae bacterium]|nr:methyltransferase [Casimicrobiaceae bacterium]
MKPSTRRPASRARPRAAALLAPSVEVSDEAGVRYLHFGSAWIQGAMRLRRTHALELEYTRDMMFPLLLEPVDWPGRVLQVGLGAGSITKFLLRHRPRAQLTVVEVDPRVVAAAHAHFRLPRVEPRLSVELGDGAAYVAGQGGLFDWIVVDGFDARGQAGMLDTRAFYAHCRARLAPAGVLTTNLLRRTRGCEPSLARLRDAFDGRALALPTCTSGNTVALAATGAPRALDRRALTEAATRLRAETGLSLLRTVGRLAAVTPKAGGLAL